MGNSVRFGYRVERKNGWSTHKYPYDLVGEPRYNLATGTIDNRVHGVDRDAVVTLRAGKRSDKTIGLTGKNAARVASELADGPGITASEIPVFKAAMEAIKGRRVQVTDASGHWRDLKVSATGAERFLKGIDGAKVVRGKRDALDPTSAQQVIEHLRPALSAISVFHESGDNGVEVSHAHLPGINNFQAALAAAPKPYPQDRSTFSSSANRGAAAIEEFLGVARLHFDDFRPTLTDDDPERNDEINATVEGFAEAVRTAFGPLSEVAMATGGDSFAPYLFGKTRDGYVVLKVEPYRDG